MASACACCALCLCPCSCPQLRRRAAALLPQPSPQQQQHDATPLTNMDITLLKDQYNSIRRKQQHETRVICFKQATSSNEDLSSQPLVNLVPMRQVQHSLIKQEAIQETQFDFVRDPESATWRTHLGMYRRTFMVRDTQNKAFKVNASTEDTTSLASVDNVECNIEAMEPNDRVLKHSEGPTCNINLSHNVQEDGGSESSRKFSAHASLTRQLSTGSYRSTHSTDSSYYYYPFPQLKCPKKSEAARKLGLYSSF